ncbi:hypothetical protein D3C80_1822580 [compost metagenome]
MLAEVSPEGNTHHIRQRQAGEHQRNSAGLFVGRDYGGGDDGTDAEKGTVTECGQHAA